jgi:glycosyltransferase involved in cell wall biosynthesis
MTDIKYQYKFTVFTPTYNRANLLPRVYESLVRQTYKNFEWLIVDDGSTDNTKEIVESFVKSASFPVRYIWKSNGGAHTADNLGVRNARGEFFAIMDSDDWYIDDALQIMLEVWNSIQESDKHKFCGVCGLFAYDDGKIVGSKFPQEVWDSDDFAFMNIYRINGDKIGCKLTDILKKFPFPEDVGQFVTEATVWNRIGIAYSTRFINRVLAIKQYQTGGLTDNGRINVIKNPKAMVLYYSELLNCKKRLPLLVSLKAEINLMRFLFHSRLSFKNLYNSIPNKISLILCPISILLILRDIWILKRQNKLYS